MTLGWIFFSLTFFLFYATTLTSYVGDAGSRVASIQANSIEELLANPGFKFQVIKGGSTHNMLRVNDASA